MSVNEKTITETLEKRKDEKCTFYDKKATEDVTPENEIQFFNENISNANVHRQI
ncbi:10260_t:CDS:1, partial [Diversispora eburnea]